MRTRDLLDDEEYSSQRSRLKLELAGTDEQLRGTEVRANNWVELTEKAFDFATYAQINFRKGDAKTKRGILMTLGENLLLKDGKLSLQQSEWLVPIGENYPAIESAYLTKVGTKQKTSPKVKEEALASVYDSWRARWDSNPRHAA